MNETWDLFAVDYNEDYEPYVYLVATLIQRRIEFLVSPEAAKHQKSIEFDWPDDDPEYKVLMEDRFARATVEGAD